VINKNMKLLLLTSLLLDVANGYTFDTVDGRPRKEEADTLQPKVTTVEHLPAKRNIGSLSRPDGSEWCQGLPTYWLIGHDPDDSPWCQVEDGTWKRSNTTKLDLIDELNGADGDIRIDRHDCVYCDVDGDGIEDIVCSVGANCGKGVGYNELYITEEDGSLIKVLEHGFQKYPTLRTRVMAKLNGAKGSQLIFVATDGNIREDGQTNLHRMFRVTNASASYFEEVQEDNGPWLVPSKAHSVKIADINNDGLDDMIICNCEASAMIFVQNEDETFTNVPLTGSRTRNWRNMRVADVTGDGILDMIVTTGYRWDQLQQLKLIIFKGSVTAPFFEATPYYERLLNYAAPNVEILDVNDDGLLDIYVVQADETTGGTYCGNGFDFVFWTGNPGPYPHNASFVPPLDYAQDILLVGTENDTSPFEVVMMEHSEPGCGYWAEAFGDKKTMILGQGEFDRVGHNLLLEW
jgi:hypothetical protein